MKCSLAVTAAVTVWLAALCTCASTRVSEATWDGRETFSRSKPLALDVAVLGGASKDSTTSKVLRDVVNDAKSSPSKNKVLLLGDCGIMAMHCNEPPIARRTLNYAVSIMGGVTTAGKSTGKARSLFGSEDEKLFKGEPYERAVVLLYRGLLYLADGDIDNAQACFKSGALQDVLASDESTRSDWLSHDLLLLLCKRMAKTTDAEEWLAFMQERYLEAYLPPDWTIERSRPVVVVVTTGSPPVKLHSGTKEVGLKYKRIESRAKSVKIANDKVEVVCTRPVDDCYIQAVTRGRRQMDGVLANKEKSKKGIKAGAVALDVAGAVASIFFGDLAGAAFQLGRDAALAAAEGVNTSADVRQMRMIPGKVFLYVGNTADLSGSLRIAVVDSSGRTCASGTSYVDGSATQPQVVLARFPY